MSRKPKLEQYRLMPDFNKEALRAPNMNHREYRDNIVAREKGILDGIRENVKNIVSQHGGLVSRDAADFGISGTSGQFGNYMIVQIPPAALAELQKLPETKIEKFANATFNLPRTF